MGAVVVGMLVVGVVVFALQQVSLALHPFPDGVDPMAMDSPEFIAHVESMPAAAWAVAFLSELVGAFLGALAASRVAPAQARIVSGVVVGLAVLASASNWLAFTHPLWFIVGQAVLYPVVLMGVWALATDRSAEA